jgi:hypothetical protein
MIVEIIVPEGFNPRDRDACYNLIRLNNNLTFTKGEVTVVKLLKGEKPLDEPGFLLAALADVTPYGVDLALIGRYLPDKAQILCGPNRGKVIDV